MRVISICPSNTEIIEYLGLSHFLVGVDDHSNWPESIKNLPRLGPDLNINIDLVEQLQPDLVLASLSVPGMERNIEQLEKRGIPHIVLNPQSLADIERELIVTATALGESERGEISALKFRNRLNVIQAQSKKLNPRPKLYWEWWPKPVFTPGKQNWLTEISHAAGAVNVFEDVDVASVQTDWDEVLSRKPDYFCLAWVGVRKEKVQKGHVIKRSGFKNLNYSAENILILEEELFCRPSPRLLDGLEILQALIYENILQK